MQKIQRLRAKIRGSVAFTLVILPLSIIATNVAAVAVISSVALAYGFSRIAPSRSYVQDGEIGWVRVLLEALVSPAIETLLFIYLPSVLLGKIRRRVPVCWALGVALFVGALHGLLGPMWGLAAGIAFFLYAVSYALILEERSLLYGLIFAFGTHAAQNTFAIFLTITRD